MNARELAFDLLHGWTRSRVPADDLLNEQLTRAKCSVADRGLATELFYGSLRNLSALQWLLSQLATKQPRAPVAAILQLGLYQLFFLEKIPAHAAVHETVELAKKHASPSEAKFVNAVLRAAGRESETLRARLHALRVTEPWVYFSHPRWLFERWQSRWGSERAVALCEWNNQPPPIYIRVNTLETAGKPAEIIAEPTAFHSLAWKVGDTASLFSSQAWADGKFYVQDPSTLVAVDALDPQPGDSVLDMCAAPGGKTTYIAQKMQNRGRIIAADSSNARLGQVAENCQRLGVTIVATLPCEGTRLDRCLRGDQFDRVLVDAPCSNTGVLRRRVDLRWRIEEKEITRLAALQLKLLGSAAQFIKPGGVLVYSTCSLEPEENEGVVEQFSKAHRPFTVESTRSFFPARDGVDGAFVARFIRKK